MCVAQLRGVEFHAELGEDGVTPVTEGMACMSFSALDDVAKWLGFDDSDEYNNAMRREGAAIMDRVRTKEERKEQST